MYEKLSQHDERMELLEKGVEENRKNIIDLKKSDEDTEQILSKQEQRIIKIESNYINLENTIMKENRDTREAMQAQTDRQWGFIEQMTGIKESESQRNHDLKVHKFNGLTKIFLNLAGAGGIIYLLLQDWFLSK